jgi:DNA invertase Pin-like site-specific DNA recombinase
MTLVSIQKFAVAYARVSTKEQEIENQKIALRNYAEQNGYRIITFFVDEAISGKVPPLERPGFRALVELIKSERVDAVLTYELTRIGRSMFESIDAIKIIEQYWMLLSCSQRETFLQSTEPSVRKLLIGIFTWVSERERELLIQRTKDGMERARLSGKRIGRQKKVLDKEVVLTMLVSKIPKEKIAELLKCSKGTLYVNLHKWNIPLGKYRRYKQWKR